MSHPKQSQTVPRPVEDHSILYSPQSRHGGLWSVVLATMKRKPGIPLLLSFAAGVFEHLPVPVVQFLGGGTGGGT